MSFLDKIRGAALHQIDAINRLANPFEKFTRAPSIIDHVSLEKKAEIYSDDITRNWLFGPNREFYWSMKRNDGGDMAIWQGHYAAMCALSDDNSATTRALTGLRVLQTVSGTNRLCRGADEAVETPDGWRPLHMSYDPSRRYFVSRFGDDHYIYHGNVSESTLLGHLFGYWAILVFGEAEHWPLVKKLVVDLADQVVSDGYFLRDPDGTPAKFGDLRPSASTAPIRLASLAALLLMADHCKPDGPYGKLYAEIADDHMGALTHPETHFLYIHPQYQDILAYMVLTVLLAFSSKYPSHRRQFAKSLEFQWKKNCEEGNSLYTYLVKYNLGKVDPRHEEKAKQILMEFNATDSTSPTGKSAGYATNSNDASIAKFRWGKEIVAKQPLPIWRRPSADFFWQRNPYGLDGHSDHFFNNMDFLIAYHLGKFVGSL